MAEFFYRDRGAAESESIAHSHTAAYSDSDPNAGDYSVSYTNCNSCEHADADSDADSNSNTYTHAYSAPDSNTDAYILSHPEPFNHATADCDSHTYTYTYTHANAHPDAYSHSNTVTPADANAPSSYTYSHSPMIRIFIGYDTKEPVSYAVACHSLMTRSSAPVSINPLILNALDFDRPRDPKQSTEFAFSRFLIPSLCGYEGWAIFMDCDVLVLDDIAKLWALRDDRYAVQVVKHDHQPRETVKFLGQAQSIYPKKNWSSVMLMNCGRCTALSPEYVKTASGLDLHRFNWIPEALVGSLPARWNHLVDYDVELPQADLSCLHYTSGGPWFKETANCGYSEVWKKELSAILP